MIHKINKSLVCVVLLILACFIALRPSDVSALTLTLDVVPTGTSYNIANGNCYFRNGTSQAASGACRAYIKPTTSSVSYLEHFTTTSSYQFTKGNYYELYVSLADNSGLPFTSILWTVRAEMSSSHFNMVSVEEVVKDSAQYHTICNQSGVICPSNNSPNGAYDTTQAYVNNVYRFIFQALDTGNYQFQLGSNNSALFYSVGLLSNDVQTWAYFSDLVEYKNGDNSAIAENTDRTADALEQQQQQDQQDRDNMDSAVGDSQSAADAAQSDVSNTTANFVNIVGSVIAAFRDTPASNCKVKTDLGNVDLGEIDFCTGKPAAFTPIFATIAAMICVPIAWYWGKHYIADAAALFESFTGTSMGGFD